MNYLAIDTSGKYLTVAIKYNGSYKTYFTENCGVDHSSSLMPTVERLLTEIGAKLCEMDFFACVVGAGSFTGIRIGVSTVKALCLAYGKKCLGVTSFDTLAYDIKSENTLAVIDAKHGNYYICGYKGNEKVIPESFVTTEELTTLCKGYMVVSFTDIPFEHKKADILNGLIKAVEEKQDNLLEDINALTPVYIRKSQAEENR